MIRLIPALATVAVLVGLSMPLSAQAELPPAAVDRFEAIVEIAVEVAGIGPSPFHVFLAGPVVVQRGDPQRAPGGGSVIQTEIVSMDLTGTFTDPGAPFGGVSPEPFKARLTLNRAQRSLGEIHTTRRNLTGAQSFFDVFFQLELETHAMSNTMPLRLEGTIDGFPPFGSGYRAALGGGAIAMQGTLPGHLHGMNFNPARPAQASIAKQLGLVQQYVQQIRASVAPLLHFLGVKVSGILTDCGGNPVPGIELLGLTQPPPPQSLLSPLSKDTTDTNGAYAFNVPNGSTGQVTITAFPLAQPDAAPLFTNLQNNLVINFTTTLCR